MQSQDNDKTILGGTTLDLIYSIVSEKGKKYQLEGGEIVGRGKDCDIFIDDKKISRNHAEMNIKDGRLKLKDLGSSNGTFQNGNKITEEIGLSNGDIISFEKHVFNVKIEMSQNEQGEQAQEVDTTEEDETDYTAVVDMSDDYIAKLSAASKKAAPPAPPKAEETPVVKETIKPKEEAPVSSNDENIPKSWVEESGAVDGTRMMDVGQLNALRAGSNTVSHNESEITRLHCFIDGQDEEIIELNVSDFTQASGWEIGRDAACDIVLDHGSVSNRHAQIIHQNGRWKIVNLVSTNGIMINGQKKLTTYLSDGDKIGLGSVNLIFKAAKSTTKATKMNNSVQKQSKPFPVVPILLTLILIVLAALIYLYLK